MMVVERKLEDQAKLLLEAGAKVDEEDKDGRMPLEMDACQHIRLRAKVSSFSWLVLLPV